MAAWFEGYRAYDDDTLAARAAEARTLHATAQTVLATARQALAEADPAAAERRRRQAVEGLQVQRAEAEQARDRLNQLTGRVEMMAGEGRREAFELAVQVFDEARAQLTSVDRRARAAQLWRCARASRWMEEEVSRTAAHLR